MWGYIGAFVLIAIVLFAYAACRAAGIADRR